MKSYFPYNGFYYKYFVLCEDLLRSGHRIRLVGDNVSWHVGVRDVWSGHVAHMQHAFATIAAVEIQNNDTPADIANAIQCIGWIQASSRMWNTWINWTAMCCKSKVGSNFDVEVNTVVCYQSHSHVTAIEDLKQVLDMLTNDNLLVCNQSLWFFV